MRFQSNEDRAIATICQLIASNRWKLLKRTIMILSTTPQIEGRPIREYKGVVTGEVIIGANVFKDFMAGLTDFFGGRSGSYEMYF